MSERCNGCGTRELPTTAFECHWPDGRTTIERLCDTCRRSWHPQLVLLGAKLIRVPVDGETRAGHLTLEPPRRRPKRT